MKRRIAVLLPVVAALALGLAIESRPASAAYYQWLKISAGVGTWMQGAISGSSTNLTMGRYTPTDSGTTSWWQYAGSFANSTGSRNQVMRWGWNLGNGGGRVTTGALNGALGDEFEQRYYTGSAWVMERHFVYVDPADTQTRFISFLGGLGAPYSTGLYLNAGTIVMGIGNNNNAPASINLTAAATLISSPGQYPRLLATDEDDTISIINGDAGNPNRGSVSVAQNGTVALTSSVLGRLISSNQNVLDWDSSGLTMRSPSGSMRIVVDDNGPYLYSGGVPKLFVQASATYTAQVFRPNVDKSATVVLGTSGGRFGWAATALAVGSLPTCDADSGGTFTVAEGGGGVADILKVCMKNAANNYAWRDVYAP